MGFGATIEYFHLLNRFSLGFGGYKTKIFTRFYQTKHNNDTITNNTALAMANGCLGAAVFPK